MLKQDALVNTLRSFHSAKILALQSLEVLEEKDPGFSERFFKNYSVAESEFERLLAVRQLIDYAITNFNHE